MASWGRRIVTAAAVGAALYFAIEGGEWGTVALVRQRSHSEALTDSVAVLTHVVDSLARFKTLVLTDAATQERIAREQFGYVRGGEVVYRVVDRIAPDSSRAKTAKKPAP